MSNIVRSSVIKPTLYASLFYKEMTCINLVTCHKVYKIFVTGPYDRWTKNLFLSACDIRSVIFFAIFDFRLHQININTS
jgi:hypothetical protein